MTTLLEIKPRIHDFIELNLDNVFANKVYWLGERRNVPEYPYCLLNVIAENKDKRTSRHNDGLVEVLESGQTDPFYLRKRVVTRYKTCTITVGIYNAWVEDTYDTSDMDVAKEFAYQQIDNLEWCFEEYPLNVQFSIQNISPIRPLHEVVDGGYMYRYEFDLTIGYNEPVTSEMDIGKSVEADVGDIEFKVTIDNNDNIEVENNIRS